MIDNAPSHPSETELRTKDGNIVAMFMPPNVTPLIQPMDQNAIKITKLHYRNSLLASVAAKNKNLIESMKTLTLKDAIVLLHDAWNRVNTQTLAKCWKNILSMLEPEEDEDDNIPLSILKEKLNLGVDSLINSTLNLLNILSPEVCL